MFEIRIKTTPARLWQAITDPVMRARCSFGVRVSSDGSQVLEGENLEVDPPKRRAES